MEVTQGGEGGVAACVWLVTAEWKWIHGALV